MAAAREAWFAAQIDLDPEKLVFIDETGANTKMAGCAAVPRVASAAGRRCPSVIGTRPPSLRACA